MNKPISMCLLFVAALSINANHMFAESYLIETNTINRFSYQIDLREQFVPKDVLHQLLLKKQALVIKGHPNPVATAVQCADVTTVEDALSLSNRKASSVLIVKSDSILKISGGGNLFKANHVGIADLIIVQWAD